MTVWRFGERLMAMDETAWQRQSNLISGWSRTTILPLLFAAIWSKVSLGWRPLLPVSLVILRTCSILAFSPRRPP